VRGRKGAGDGVVAAGRRHTGGIALIWGVVGGIDGELGGLTCQTP